MSDLQKTVISFCIAVLTAFVGALLVAAFTSKNTYFLIAFGIFSAYILIAGFQRNGPYERSIGMFLDQPTGWIIPTGISWWIPRPLGGSTGKTNIQRRKLDRRDEATLTNVVTRDGATVEVSFYFIFEIFDLKTWVRTEEPLQALEALAEREVRWFATCWDSDGDYSVALQKETFSAYLRGEEVSGPADKIDPETEEPKKLISDMIQNAAKVGVRIIVATVDDVNPPKAVIEAREAEIIEEAEAAKESANMRALLETMSMLKEKFPGLSDQELLRAAQVEKGAVQSIHVSGDAGDFTKGAVAGKDRKK